MRGGAPALAVLAALGEEIAPLRRRLVGRRRLRLDAGRAWRGRLGAHDVVLHLGGDGARRARLAAGHLARAVGTCPVLAIGLAGALDPALGPLDLVAAERIVGEDGREVAAPDAALHARLLALSGVVAGSALAAGALVRRVESKAALHEATGARTVDLESGAWAEALAEAGRRFAVLRVVSDAADEPLPALLEHASRADGSIARWRVAMGAVTCPRHVPALRRLAHRAREGGERLATAVLALLDGPAP